MSGDRGKERFSAHRAQALGLGCVAVLVGGLAGWGHFAPISAAVIASGRVAVQSRNQSVEHIDGGTVDEVLVRDGDRIDRNQLLLRLAGSTLRSEAAMLETQYAELAALRNRLEAEYRAADGIAWDADLVSLAATGATIRDILDGQQRLYLARKAARAGEKALLRERIGQAREEITGLEARAVSIGQQSELIVRELDLHRDTFERGLTRLDQLLELERAAKNLEGNAGTNAAMIARVRGEIAELELQILQLDARWIQEAEEQARAAKARENQVRERLALVRERLEGKEVRAPVSGTVFGMTVFAAGEVVRPAEPILQIVPEGSDLVVMARIDPGNVDEVYAGQDAVLRFTAFPLQSTPEREGRVVRVSADSVHDGESGESWYEIELAVVGPAGKLALTPGMPVEVFIRTGDRSAISYLAKPITDFFQRSMREE